MAVQPDVLTIREYSLDSLQERNCIFLIYISSQNFFDAFEYELFVVIPSQGSDLGLILFLDAWVWGRTAGFRWTRGAGESAVSTSVRWTSVSVASTSATSVSAVRLTKSCPGQSSTQLLEQQHNRERQQQQQQQQAHQRHKSRQQQCQHYHRRKDKRQ